jgi:hypothetical protein
LEIVATSSGGFRTLVTAEIKTKGNKRRTGEEPVGNRQKKKPPAMKAELLQPKCISSPSSKKKELLSALFLFLVAKTELVSQNVPNPQCTNAL